MSYYLTGITVIGSERTRLGFILHAKTTYTSKVVQLYLSGALRESRAPVDGVVSFEFSPIRETDIIFLLNVDTENAGTDYFDDAYPDLTANANRLRVTSPRVLAQPWGVKWRVYRGAAGAASATVLAYEVPYYDSISVSGGFGPQFGDYFGYGPAPDGFGVQFGYVFGFDVGSLQWTSEPLPPGAYPVKAVVVDLAGNESTAATDTITLTTYPRPATDFAVGSYTNGTDTLSLTWTASPDIT